MWVPLAAQALAEQMAPLAKALLIEPEARASGDDTSSPTAYDQVLSEVVPLLTSLLSGGPQEVSGVGGSIQLAEAATDALLQVASLIKPHDVGDTVLRAVLCLAHDNEIEENRVVATQLLGSLAPALGAELCKQYVLPELLCLADDPAFRVRKAAALRVGSVASVVGTELAVAKLLPVFEVLARDEIWGVRKASVESVAEVAAVMPLEVRTGPLEKLVHEFHSDASRWVRIAACQALGPFIATLPSDHVSAPLLEIFTQLANPSNPTAADSDVAYSCAFNFPGVATAVGASRWAEISASFNALAANIQWKVRRTLAYSLHDLAAILGPELTESELLPTFELFIKDLDEVKVGLIQHLAAFLSVLTPKTRLTYLPALAEIRAETDNWRFRQMLASQLAAFGSAFASEDVEETLLPLALHLCTDSVAQVRIAAVAQVGLLVEELRSRASAPATEPLSGAFVSDADRATDADGPAGGDSSSGGDASGSGAALSGGLSNFLDLVVGMATAPSCYKRANCVQICDSLLAGLPSTASAERILPSLLPLVHDRVANVRLALAVLAERRLLPSESPYAGLPVSASIIEALRADVDRDVLRAVHTEPGYEPPPYRCKPLPPSSLAALMPACRAPGEDGGVDAGAGETAGATESAAGNEADTAEQAPELEAASPPAAVELPDGGQSINDTMATLSLGSSGDELI